MTCKNYHQWYLSNTPDLDVSMATARVHTTLYWIRLSACIIYAVVQIADERWRMDRFIQMAQKCFFFFLIISLKQLLKSFIKLH